MLRTSWLKSWQSTSQSCNFHDRKHHGTMNLALDFTWRPFFTMKKLKHILRWSPQYGSSDSSLHPCTDCMERPRTEMQHSIINSPSFSAVWKLRFRGFCFTKENPQTGILSKFFKQSPQINPRAAFQPSGVSQQIPSIAMSLVWQASDLGSGSIRLRQQLHATPRLPLPHQSLAGTWHLSRQEATESSSEPENLLLLTLLPKPNGAA